MPASFLTKLEITAPDELYDKVLLKLFALFSQGWQEITSHNGQTEFVIYCEDAQFAKAASEKIGAVSDQIEIKLSLEKIPDPLHAWKQFFTPVVCGNNFVVLPPWRQNECFPQPYKIIIEPKSAFGTGHHATTALCLEALSNMLERKIIKQGDKFLDLGCGSGVLAIAATRAGLCGLAADIDPLAIMNAQENGELNNIDNLQFIEGSIEGVSHQEFDLVMANILAGPLIALSDKICSVLKKDGKLILSGILQIQAEEVIEAYRQNGLSQPEIMNSGEWSCLVWN